jgi:hypothetical protein
MGVLAAAWALEDGEGSDEVDKWLRCAIGLGENYKQFATH